MIDRQRAKNSIHDRRAVRAYALQSVFEKTDRILSPNDPRVRVEKSTIDAPGFTDGSIITINASDDYVHQCLVEGFNARRMLVLSGINYHELAHHLFTPRMDANLADRVREKDAWLAFNILEDQAAETRFVTLYRPAADYFIGTVSQYILDHPQGRDLNYVLVSGRLFIPRVAREKMRDSFVKQEHIDRIDEIVAEYKTLSSPFDDSRMFDLIVELMQILQDSSPNPSGNLSGIGDHIQITEGDPDEDTGNRVTVILDREGEFEHGDEDEDAPEGSGGKEGDDEEENESEGKGESDGDDESESKSTKPNDSGAGGRSLTVILDEIVDESLDHSQDEIESRIRNIRQEEANYRSTETRDMAHTPARVTPRDNDIVRRCRDELRLLETQALPGWDPFRRTGKLNPRAYARALRGDEHVYRRWTQGVHNALDFEVAVILDLSGSMSRHRQESGRAMWVIRRMFDLVKGSTTLYGYNNEHWLLSQRGERAELTTYPVYGCFGGTNPDGALHEARRIMDVSRRRQKLVVLITDGQFNRPDPTASVMKSIDHPIMVVGINYDVSRFLQTVPSVISARTVGDPMELVELVRETAMGMAREVMG